MKKLNPTKPLNAKTDWSREVINESNYSTEKAQYSLDIGDHMNIDNQWLINRIKVLESQASQFESTLKETMKMRDEYKEKLKIAVETLKEIASGYNRTCMCCDGGEFKYDEAKEALEKIGEI